MSLAKRNGPLSAALNSEDVMPKFGYEKVVFGPEGLRGTNPVASAANAGLPAADRFIGEEECLERTDLSRVTRWRGVRAGWFPAPVQIAPNRKAWLDSEITAWLRDRAAGVIPTGMPVKPPPRRRSAEQEPARPAALHKCKRPEGMAVPNPAATSQALDAEKIATKPHLSKRDRATSAAPIGDFTEALLSALPMPVDKSPEIIAELQRPEAEARDAGLLA